MPILRPEAILVKRCDLACAAPSPPSGRAPQALVRHGEAGKRTPPPGSAPSSPVVGPGEAGRHAGRAAGRPPPGRVGNIL